MSDSRAVACEGLFLVFCVCEDEMEIIARIAQIAEPVIILTEFSPSECSQKASPNYETMRQTAIKVFPCRLLPGDWNADVGTRQPFAEPGTPGRLSTEHAGDPYRVIEPRRLA